MDKSGIDTYLYREYGCASQGQRVFGQIRGRKYQRCGIIAAQMGNRILAPFQYNGTMDSSLFKFWFSNQFLLFLGQGTVTIMDNTFFHSKKRNNGYFGRFRVVAAEESVKPAWYCTAPVLSCHREAAENYKGYHHVQWEQRLKIERALRTGAKPTAIAKETCI